MVYCGWVVAVTNGPPKEPPPTAFHHGLHGGNPNLSQNHRDNRLNLLAIPVRKVLVRRVSGFNYPGVWTLFPVWILSENLVALYFERCLDPTYLRSLHTEQAIVSGIRGLIEETTSVRGSENNS